MATVKFSTPSAWADAFAAADFNALANNAGKLSTAGVVANGTDRAMMADLSFIMVTSTITPAGGQHLQFFLLPLLHDGSSYPDQENTAVQADLPHASLMVAQIGFRSKATQSVKGMARGIIIPPGSFQWYVVNRMGNALPSSATNMTCRYRTYGYEIA